MKYVYVFDAKVDTLSYTDVTRVLQFDYKQDFFHIYYIIDIHHNINHLSLIHSFFRNVIVLGSFTHLPLLATFIVLPSRWVRV